mmetsp:Transcript_143585/g.459280  ORF Transcript_143585/g.459280 Transcript_143585/m.459280 type:complete len:209 (+) Transcript_143585:278-904(+)
MEGAQSALEFALLAVQIHTQGVLRDLAVPALHMLVRVPPENTAWHVLLNPDDVVEPRREHAVNHNVPEELVEPALVPNSLGKERIDDVGPLQVQQPVAALHTETLALGVVDDPVALAGREEVGDADAVEALEVDGLQLLDVLEDAAEPAALRARLHRLLRGRLHPLWPGRRGRQLDLHARQLDLHVDPDVVGPWQPEVLRNFEVRYAT